MVWFDNTPSNMLCDESVKMHTGAVVMFVVVGVLCLLCALGTLCDHVAGFPCLSVAYFRTSDDWEVLIHFVFFLIALNVYMKNVKMKNNSKLDFGLKYRMSMCIDGKPSNTFIFLLKELKDITLSFLSPMVSSKFNKSKRTSDAVKIFFRNIFYCDIWSPPHKIIGQNC